MMQNPKVKNRFKLNRKRILISLSAALLCAGVGSGFASNYAFAYTVKVNDTVVGTVPTKEAYYDVLEEIKTESRDTANIDFKTGGTERFSPNLVKKGEVTDRNDLAENLKATSLEMIEAATITANGEEIAVVLNEENARKILEDYLSAYSNAEAGITASFTDNVEITKAFVGKSVLETVDVVKEKLARGRMTQYIAEDGDTQDSVCEAYGITKEELLLHNPQLTEDSLNGTTLTIPTHTPYLSVTTVTHFCGEIQVPFETESTQDNTLYEGKTVIDEPGENGIYYEESYITAIDGKETHKETICYQVVQEAKTQKERVGTRPLPSSAGTGEFTVPTMGTRTSSYGARWGRMHNGMDIAAAIGTDVFAADNGIVTQASDKSNGYGNMIIIDHQNGYQTYYAHLSQINVSVGDVIAKGDLIGLVGNTGNSTGPHLHFEVRVDGTPDDPAKYIGQ